MKARSWTAVLLAAAALGMAVGIRLASTPLVPIAIPPLSRVAVPLAAASAPQRRDSLGRTLIAHDPFHITRRPSPAPYDPARLVQPSVSPPPKPTLVLLGIVWDTGTDPTALVDGLPGADRPRPVRPGETVSGLHVTAIKRDRVVVTGLDTTWILTVRRPWR